MSKNTNTLFWVITGAVIVIGLFLIINSFNNDSIKKATGKISSVFQNAVKKSDEEELNNPTNIKKYYGHNENWDSIEVESTTLFEFDEKTGTVLKYNGNSSKIVIPFQINGVTVKKVGPIGRDLYTKNNEYQNCEDLLWREQRYPDDERNIEERKKYEANGILNGDECLKKIEIEEIILPNTIEELGDFSLYYTEKLESIKLPSNLKKIGNQAFFSSGLKELDLSNLTNLEYIGDYAFNNSQIEGNLVIPDSLTYLGYYSFGGNNLKSVVLSKNLVELQDRTFFANTNLISFTFRGTNTKVGSINIFYKHANPTIYVPKGSLDWYKSFSYLTNYKIKEV